MRAPQRAGLPLCARDRPQVMTRCRAAGCACNNIAGRRIVAGCCAEAIAVAVPRRDPVGSDADYCAATTCLLKVQAAHAHDRMHEKAVQVVI